VKARFALVGRPDPGNPASIEQNILQRWVEEGIIEWWGWQSDMNSVYKQCHIVTLPSVGEGAPSVLMEAAACGRPVVTTDTPGCRDMVKAGISGLIVPPNDAAALAEALSKLISDPDLRARMGNAGRKLAVEEFSNVYANQATLGVYRAHI
jgi:glycosyltransferase involved in cell wall biosynthesis